MRVGHRIGGGERRTGERRPRRPEGKGWRRGGALHTERIDLDGFKFFVLVGLDATNFILSLD